MPGKPRTRSAARRKTRPPMPVSTAASAWLAAEILKRVKFSGGYKAVKDTVRIAVKFAGLRWDDVDETCLVRLLASLAGIPRNVVLLGIDDGFTSAERAASAATEGTNTAFRQREKGAFAHGN